jgi:hypothetical protein
LQLLNVLLGPGKGKGVGDLPAPSAMARSAAWTPCGRWSTLDAAAVAILIDAPFNHPNRVVSGATTA